MPLSCRLGLLLVAAALLAQLDAATLPGTSLALPFADSQWVPEHVRTMPHRLDANHWMDVAAAEYRAHETVISDNCQNLVGNGYLQRWNASRVEYCRPDAPGDSSMTCLVHPRRPNEAGTITCLNRNVVLDSAAFLSGGPGKLSDPRMPSPQAGSMRLACTIPSPKPISDVVAQREDMDRGYMLTALKAKGGDSRVRAACAAGGANVVPHPVVFIGRWDPTNPWHHNEDLVNLFVQLHLLHDALPEVRSQGLQVVFVDTKPKGWFLHLWRRISYPHPLRFLVDDPFPDNTCFPLMLQHGRPVVSLFCAHGVGAPMDCRSVVMHGFQIWLHALFAELHPRNYAPGERANEVEVRRVMWATRRNQESLHQHKMSSWQLNRVLHNEDDLVRRLMELVMQWNKRSCMRAGHPANKAAVARSLPRHMGAQRQPLDAALDAGGAACRNSSLVFEFSVSEPSDLRFYPEQLTLLAHTNIYMAVHGAGMHNFLWMPRGQAAAVEVLHNSYGNFHYHNSAKWLGVDYTNTRSGGDIEAIGAAMLGAMDRMATRHDADKEKGLGPW